MTDLTNQAAEVKAQLRNFAEHLRANNDLTPDAKNRLAAEEWERGSAKLAALADQDLQAAERARSSARAELYRAPSSEPARVATYRDAMVRAQSADGTEALRKVYELAKLTGDDDQMRAAFVIASQTSASDPFIVDDYLEANPQLRRKYDELSELDGGGMVNFARGLAFGTPTMPRF